jgi:hypothetical protein
MQVKRVIPFTQAQVRRAVKAAESAGLKVSKVTINPNGSITLESGDNGPSSMDTRKKAIAASWDDA